jgi:hypothetical protein
MHRCRKTILALALAALAGTSNGASAAMLCITSGTDLQQALTIAGTNNQADDIRLVAGTFTTQSAPNGLRWFFSTPQNFAFVLSGGWAPGCMAPHPQGLPTVLSGQETARVFDIVASAGTGSIVVRDLTLQGGRATTITKGSALRIGSTSMFDGSVTVERVRVTGTLDTMSDTAAINVDASGGIVTIRDSLVADNVSGIAVRLAAMSATLRFTNNTVVDQSGLLDEASQLFAFNGGRLEFTNNVFARNFGPLAAGYTETFSTGPSGAIELRNNHLSRGFLGTNAVNVDTTTGDARIAAIGLPVPAADSPLRNAGLGAPAGGLAAEDLTRAKRVQGGRVDKGAVEFPEIFTNGFE